MAFALAGTTITQTGTDATLAGLAGIAGVAAPAGGRLYSTGVNRMTVTGNLTIPVETLQVTRLFVTGAAASLTIGADDGNSISGGVLYLSAPDNGDFGGVFGCTGGATINLRNADVYVGDGATFAAEIGGFGQSWILNAKNVNFWRAGAAGAFHYIGGGGSLENVSWRNCQAVFFNSSPAVASGLKVIASDWGFGIDGVGITLSLVGSVAPRAVIQRANNIINLIDCQTTDWVACRLAADATSTFRFLRRVGVAAFGANAGLVPYYILDNANAILVTGTTSASGAAASQNVQWGQVNTGRIGENGDPNVAANKFTAANINGNTGIGHDAGQYRLPLAAIFAKYDTALSVQTGITFDVTQAANLSPFVLAPALVADTNVTLSEAAAVAKLASSFVVDRAANTITVTQASTLDDLHDALKAYKTRPVQAQLVYPSVATQPVFADGQTLASAMNIVVQAGVALTRGVKFTNIRTTGTVTVNGSFNGGIVDANGNSFLSFESIDAWEVYSNPARTNLLDSGTGSEIFRFNFAAGTTYHLTVVTGVTTYNMTSTPAAAGQTVVSLETPALLLTLQSLVAQRPTLPEIEASALAKESTVQAVLALSLG